MASALATLASCRTLHTGAVDRFAVEHSCPEARVTSRERPDIPPAEALDPEPTVDRAPAEVAADPERLAKWQADRRASREARASEYSGFDIWEVEGCGHTDLLACHHPLGRRGIRTDSVVCRHVKWPPRSAPRGLPPPSPASPPATAAPPPPPAAPPPLPNVHQDTSTPPPAAPAVRE